MGVIPDEIEIEAFRVGKQTAMSGEERNYSHQDLQDMADTYNPEDPSPVVIGHPATNDPAYGWIKGVRKVGEKLLIKYGEMTSEFKEWLDNRHFKKVSISVYPPDSPYNPTPGKYSIRHLGYLGAAPPAVKGLKPVSFSESEGCLEFAIEFSADYEGLAVVSLLRSLRDHLIESTSLEVADRVLPSYQLDSLNQQMSDRPNFAPIYLFESLSAEVGELRQKLWELTSGNSAYSEVKEKPQPEVIMPPEENQNLEFSQMRAEFEEQKRQLEEQKKQLNDLTEVVKAERQQLNTERQKLETEKVSSFVEGLVKNFQVLPAEKDATIKLILATPNDTAIEFSEGNSCSPRQQLMNSYKSRPQYVDNKEIVTPDTDPGVVTGGLNFSLPPGTTVDSESAKLHSRILAYQQQHPEVEYTDAAFIVQKGGK